MREKNVTGDEAGRGPSRRKSKKIEDDLVSLLARYQKPLSRLIKSVADLFMAAKQSEATYSVAMARLVAYLICLIVVVAAVLTYCEKVDGAAFTFLLGLIVGYLLTFVREAIRPRGE